MMKHMHTAIASIVGWAVGAVALLTGAGYWAQAATPAAAPVAGKGAAVAIDFNRDIRPILSENCFACHGPDKAARKARLRLDIKDEALKEMRGGDFAIVPGNVGKSVAIERVVAEDEEERMPPVDSGKKLSKEQIDLLKRWVEQGAKWDEHWSFVPATRPAVPEVKDAGWVKNDVDRFILARLEREGMKPSPEASRETLIRRVTFDLTGLPPTIAEVDAFLADQSPGAYEKVVERLLASPRFGERMALHWLDLARYADTNGYHIDNHRDMWKWREWVIDAFNQNKRWDEFVVEQLAGDMLPNATLEQKIASGFNRNTMVNFEGGADPDEYLTKYIVDRVNTTATVFLGVTMQCAECHDHKYDPISTKEFYQFYAYFHNVPEKGLDGERVNPVPSIPVPSEEQKSQLASLKQQIAALDARLKEPHADVDAAQVAWEEKTVAELKTKPQPRWETITATILSAKSKNGATLTRQEDGTILASGENPAQDVYEVETVANRKIAAIQLDALPHPSLGRKSVGRFENGNFVLTGIELEAWPLTEPEKKEVATFSTAVADYSQANFPVTNVIDGDAKSGWAVDGDSKREARRAVFFLREPIGVDGPMQVKVRLRFESNFAQHAIGRFRVATTPDAGPVLAMVPATLSDWHVVGPFPAETGKNAFDVEFEPEREVDLAKKYQDGKLAWAKKPEWKDGAVYPLAEDANSAHYLYRTIDAKSARGMTLSLGSDDGIKVWVNGKLVHANGAARGAAPDQDKVNIALNEGRNTVLVKVSNIAGGAGFYFSAKEVGTGRPEKVDQILLVEAEKRSDGQKAELRTFYRDTFSDAHKKMNEEVAALKKRETDLNAAIPTTMVMQEMPKPRDTHILMRGDFRSKGEKVTPGVPVAFRPPEKMPANRLELAQWLVQRDHPLMSRVTVNRFWLMYFGTGIVKTAEDFGAQGEWPSHPALLDWMASEFASHWDVKRFVRTIVTSATYRQSARVNEELLRKDLYNRLLARGPRFRLPAEMIRDHALSVSGLLNGKIGGTSVFPYQPPKLWEEVAFGGNFSSQTYVQSTGADLYRRGMYIYAKRSMPHPSLVTFDAPNREWCTVQRPITNTPLQALLLMNDPIYVEAARVMAARVMKEGGSGAAERLRYAFKLCVAREPSEREMVVLSRSLERHLETYRKDKEAAGKLVSVGESEKAKDLDVAEHAAWTALMNTLLNLDETITRA
jgi:mono/diheme cytochrome c family protein